MSNKEKFLVDGVGTFEEYLKAINKDVEIDSMPGDVISQLIDHTQLKADSCRSQIEQLCEEAIRYSFKSVCVNPYWVPLAKDMLTGSYVKVCTVIGFPLGATLCTAKAAETEQVIKAGATEVDMVLNVGAMKSRDYASVKKDVEKVVKAAQGGALTKVILETCLLSDEEISAASVICAEAGADYVKTSTGFSTGGATPKAISLMREAVGNELGVKASGGVRSLEDLVNMVKAGATRIGASCGVDIMQGKESQGTY